MFITLITKKNHHIKVVNYHFISMCNVLYKLTSMTIENRLKLALPKLIFEFESVIVFGKQIIENILIVYKLIHDLRRKRRGKYDFMFIKN